MKLFCLVLDGLPKSDDNIVDIDIQPGGRLGDLRRGLERSHPKYKRSSMNNIKVWVLREYIPMDQPISPKEFDPATSTTYDGVPVTKIQLAKHISKYFPKPPNDEDEFKIHLIFKLHGLSFVLVKVASLKLFTDTISPNNSGFIANCEYSSYSCPPPLLPDISQLHRMSF
jgi:hypothetical protein